MSDLLQNIERKIFPLNTRRRFYVRRLLGRSKAYANGLEYKRELPSPKRLSTAGQLRAQTLNEITYRYFGIDPNEYYRNRFDTRVAGVDILRPKILGHAIEKVRVRVVSDFLAENFAGQPVRVLDIGCGSGEIGPSLVRRHENLTLYGVDMSASCVATARKNGYERVSVLNFTTASLPYPDNYFDATISLDVLGHVEFRHKDGLIQELARVTRPGGMACHGVETGYVDYVSADPNDSEDPVLKYVWEDGHVGVETIQALRARFGTSFDNVTAALPFAYPFGLLSVAVKEIFGKDYDDFVDFLGDDPKRRELVSVVLGATGRYFLERYRAVTGESREPAESHEVPAGSLDGLFHAHGFCFFTATKVLKH